MRKLIGTCLLCCLWTAPALACFDEYVPVSNESRPRDEYPAPVPDLAANNPGSAVSTGTDQLSPTTWASAGFGTTGVATLLAALILASARNRRHAVSPVSNDSATS